MAKDYAESFYKSDAWERTRAAFAASKFGICERCGRPGKIVHHKVYITPANINDPAITLSWDNLELLCQDCHNREHHSNDVMQDGLYFNADGDLVESPLPEQPDRVRGTDRGRFGKHADSS